MTEAAVICCTAANAFDLGDALAYGRWREAKLADYPLRVEDLVVLIADPDNPTPAERAALLDRVRRTNMAVYAGPADAGKEQVRRLAAAFGLMRLDANVLADDDGITPLHVAESGTRTRYIPYTDKPISWHTDGYYNPPERQVRGLVLHCVRPAAAGGENELLDPEIAYILLRDADPGHIAALMAPDAMTIPENSEEGLVRPEQTGPVFALHDGVLHMRYTARKRNIRWADRPETARAVAALEELLASDSPYIFRHTLAAGQGLLCNNVLHTRTRFAEDPARGRLLFRARFYDRITGT